ncbi:MAG: prepilin-type N-terminal cleavage/methylation domain-containing protein [bacterium]|nr:prepilin-type cleavage/methylation domain-containing protein [Deltaproteobacteria bacterium]MCP4908790.1 prepilin-type N-terminal cleavage/methylation domain-containing protein [bacterium]
MSKLIRKSNKGFTLIELMIVVAIIGILAAIAIPNFLRFQLKSKSSEGKVNIAAIRTAEESYIAEFGNYVGAAISPAAAWPRTAKIPFVDVGAAGANFDTLGWAPEGQVFFSYGVNYASATPDAYTISATADIDGDSAPQSWGYVKEIGTSGVGVVGLDAACLVGGVGASQNQLETVGPCTSAMGQSVF